jgi:uncharacterized phage-associated protein
MIVRQLARCLVLMGERTKMRYSHLDINKTQQAVALLLKSHLRSQMTYTRMLKLLYLAERKTLQQTGTMITGDTVVKMPNGPVLSQLYDLIKYKNYHAPKLYRYIERRGDQIHLTKDPGIGYLSPREIENLQSVANEHVEKTDEELIDWIHSNCPEWSDPRKEGKKVSPLPRKQILMAVGMTEQQADEAIEEAEYFALVTSEMEQTERTLAAIP